MTSFCWVRTGSPVRTDPARDRCGVVGIIGSAMEEGVRMETVATPIEVDGVFDDPSAVRLLVERHGPYPSIAYYLPPSATLANADEADAAVLPWFRANWAVNGGTDVPGADRILNNPRFAAAASRLCDGAPVRPTTVVVNVNGPMGPGAIHVDIPSFHGANRDRYSLRLLQAMGTSGLFERWRIVEVGAVTWFYNGPGGAYDYWPDGLSGAMRSCQPPFDNVALVADNDRMFHRIGWIGDPHASTPTLTPTAKIHHGPVDHWTITDTGRTVCAYPDQEVRISILWKAQVLTGTVVPALTSEQIVDVITRDLATREVEVPTATEPISDDAWIDVVHRTYYPTVAGNQ